MGRPKKYKNNWPSATELVSFAYPFDKYYWVKSVFEKNKSCLGFDPFSECDRIQKEAQDIGHHVHEAIELYTDPDKYGLDKIEFLSPKELNIFDKFKEYINTNKLYKGINEKTVYSKKLKYGGTFDYLYNNILYDWKTDSKRTNPKKYHLQCTYYAIAIEEDLGIKVNKCVVVRVTKDEEPEIKIYEFEITPQMKQLAKRIRKLYKDIKGK